MAIPWIGRGILHAVSDSTSSGGPKPRSVPHGVVEAVGKDWRRSLYLGVSSQVLAVIFFLFGLAGVGSGSWPTHLDPDLATSVVVTALQVCAALVIATAAAAVGQPRGLAAELHLARLSDWFSGWSRVSSSLALAISLDVAFAGQESSRLLLVPSLIAVGLSAATGSRISGLRARALLLEYDAERLSSRLDVVRSELPDLANVTARRGRVALASLLLFVLGCSIGVVVGLGSAVDVLPSDPVAGVNKLLAGMLIGFAAGTCFAVLPPLMLPSADDFVLHGSRTFWRFPWLGLWPLLLLAVVSLSAQVGAALDWVTAMAATGLSFGGLLLVLWCGRSGRLFTATIWARGLDAAARYLEQLHQQAAEAARLLDDSPE